VGSTPEFRKAFVARLKQACDESKLVPLPGQGRQQFIAERLGVAPEAVSKWFKGVSMPMPEKMALLAELLEVDHSWLAHGISPEMDRAERKLHAKESSGAVHLVFGMIMLAGGHCGEPSKSDPRAEYVDFYATMRGSVYPMHVALAREVAKDKYEVLLPKEYRDVRTVAVIPAGPGKYHFLDMRLPLIEEYKVRKAGMISLGIGRVDGKRYMTGSALWPQIKVFGEELA
jgi:transcriptional regulator with XRE-family HTH domain